MKVNVHYKNGTQTSYYNIDQIDEDGSYTLLVRVTDAPTIWIPTQNISNLNVYDGDGEDD